MKTNRLGKISLLVQEHFGTRTALALVAAMRVARTRWTEEDTTVYGTMARDEVFREMFREEEEEV